MPKQFITVYLGVLLEQSAPNTTSTTNSTTTPPPPAGTDTKSRIITDVVLAITILITFLAMWYIYYMMNKAKPAVIYDRRKARQAKLARAASPPSSASGSNSADDIPLTAGLTSTFPHPAQPQPDDRYAPRAHRPDDAELGWDEELAGTPMQHAGMGREVAGLGSRSGLGYGPEHGGAYGGYGGGGAIGYGYVPTYQGQRGGVSAETLEPEEDVLVRVSEMEPPRGAGAGVGEFGQGRGQGQGQLTASSYRTAWDGLEGNEGAASSKRQLRNPHEAPEGLR
ncbi:hypothetical protein C0992_002400 [Termitomyces sp. T32_za158]|nr:hypothetical protein C0992_002400 [Termitomyces sp. T32_za158]